MPLPFIPLVPSSLLHLVTMMSVSGRSRVDKPSPSSSTHPPRHVSHSLLMVNTSSAEVMIIRSQSGNCLGTSTSVSLFQRLVSINILDSHNTIRASFVQVLAITTARDACVTGDLETAEELLTQEIDTHDNPPISYAHHSFVMARKHNWDHALQDALKVSYTGPSWPSYEKADFHS
jgi:hypothetical protein